MSAAADPSSCPGAERLACLVEGRLPEDERAALRRHAGECEQCCAILASLARDPADVVTETDDEAPALVVSPGATLGPYVLLDCIGHGGMGVVWRAIDPRLDRRVAIKLLSTEDRFGATSRAGARLLREARSMARLAHPNVVAVYDVGVVGDRVFLAMELVEGETLRQWLDRAPRSSAEILARFVAAGRGLAHAHALGLVHRDFKPDNVLCGRDGRVCVTDFGLARSVGPGSHVTAPAGVELDEIGRLTKTGALVGTPAYMAPEQFSGADTDARTDQFSLCVALWEALYGQRPFGGRTVGELATAVTSGTITSPPADRRVPARIERALRRGLRLDPAERWPDVATLLGELEPGRGPRRRVIAAGLGVIAAGGVVVWSMGVGDVGPRPCADSAVQLEGVWDDERREEVRRALLATGVGWAEAAATGTVSRLDQHAADWVAAYDDTCRGVDAERPSAQLDQGMACLRRRRGELEALVELLVRADAEVAEHAVQAARALPPVSVCRDPEALQAELPPPEDPALARAVEQQHGALDRAAALGRAGSMREAEADMGPVVDAATELGWDPLTAEARLVRGRLRRLLGQYDEAAEDLDQAWELARAAGSDRVAAQAASEHVVLATVRVSYDEGVTWGRHALAIVERIGGGQESEAEVRSDFGLLLLFRGELDEAERHLARSLAIRQGAPQPDPILVGESMARLGHLAIAKQDLGVAIERLRRSIESMESVVGPSHPTLVAPSLALGVAYYQQSDLDRAEHWIGRARDLHEQAHPEPHPDLVSIVTNLGNVELSRGRVAEALVLFERAQQVAEALFGPDDSQVGVALVNVAGARQELRDHEGARAAFQRTLELWERDMPDHPALAYPLTGLGAALVDLGRAEQARPHLERALAFRLASPSSPLELADTELELARALWDGGGDRVRALALARSAAERYASVEGEQAAARRSTAQAWLAAHPEP